MKITQNLRRHNKKREKSKVNTKVSKYNNNKKQKKKKKIFIFFLFI